MYDIIYCKGGEIMGIYKDLTGQKFGRTKWLCVCECGNLVEPTQNNLQRGKSKCKLYKIYHAMLDRCNNNHDKRYKNYGGRGIAVCDEWKDDFKAFYDWSIERALELEGK